MWDFIHPPKSGRWEDEEGEGSLDGGTDWGGGLGVLCARVFLLVNIGCFQNIWARRKSSEVGRE